MSHAVALAGTNTLAATSNNHISTMVSKILLPDQKKKFRACNVCHQPQISGHSKVCSGNHCTGTCDRPDKHLQVGSVNRGIAKVNKRLEKEREIKQKLELAETQRHQQINEDKEFIVEFCAWLATNFPYFKYQPNSTGPFDAARIGANVLTMVKSVGKSKQGGTAPLMNMNPVIAEQVFPQNQIESIDAASIEDVTLLYTVTHPTDSF
jgi:hypothetical protein